MKKLLSALLVLSLLVLAKPGYCWDGVGHELVAQIAYDRLTPVAKAQVDQLTNTLNSDPLTIELGETFNQLSIATWPDEIRSLGAETRQFSAWHYIDLDSLPPVKSTDASPGRPAVPIADATTIAIVKAYVNPKSDVYAQILAQSTILADKSAAGADRARALAFVEHFVGDIHQPLHAIGRQRGGNDYAVNLVTPDREYTVLHPFWDGAYRYHVVDGQITVDPLYTNRGTVTPDTGTIKTWSDLLVKDNLPTDKVILGQQDPAAWAVESAEIATSFAFPSDNSSTLSNNYVEEASEIARERIALAGYRLANFLNSLLSK